MEIISCWDLNEAQNIIMKATGCSFIAFDGDSFICEISQMKDKRGHFAALIIGNRKVRIKTRTFEELKPFMGLQFRIHPDMYGWADCSLAELPQLDEIISRREKNPPETPDLWKELGI